MDGDHEKDRQVALSDDPRLAELEGGGEIG